MSQDFQDLSRVFSDAENVVQTPGHMFRICRGIFRICFRSCRGIFRTRSGRVPRHFLLQSLDLRGGPAICKSSHCSRNNCVYWAKSARASVPEEHGRWRPRVVVETTYAEAGVSLRSYYLVLTAYYLLITYELLLANYYFLTSTYYLSFNTY